MLELAGPRSTPVADRDIARLSASDTLHCPAGAVAMRGIRYSAGGAESQAEVQPRSSSISAPDRPSGAGDANADHQRHQSVSELKLLT